MKIAFVIDQLDCGGAEQQLVTLCKGLHQRGHQVHVISIYDRTELRGELDAVEVPVIVAHKYGRFDLTTVWRLRSLIRSINPDLVHAYLPAASLLTPLTKWLGVKTPVLLSERTVNYWRSPMRLRCETVLRTHVLHITCNAEAIKRHLINIENVPPDKISVIYNGLRFDRRSRPADAAVAAARQDMGAPRDAIVVACVANFRADKQHDILLKAFAEARRQVKRLFLVLVGRYELESAVRLQIHRLGLETACRVVTDCANPRAILCASDIAVLTSRAEGCSNALLEAMAMGLPVVASDAGGNGELITHGQGGYVCPVGEIGSIADALARLASEPATAHTMGRYNIDRVRKHFTDDVMIQRSLSFYQAMLRRPISQR